MKRDSVCLLSVRRHGYRRAVSLCSRGAVDAGDSDSWRYGVSMLLATASVENPLLASGLTKTVKGPRWGSRLDGNGWLIAALGSALLKNQ